jgi:hypothetical protein
MRAHGFLARQLDADETPSQTIFDVAFGAVVPVICFLADPLVFRSGMGGRGILDRLAVYGYLEALVCVGALVLFLWTRRPSPFLAGGLIVGALYSSLMALLLLPFTGLGLLTALYGFPLGFLAFFGLAPLPSAFVYLRNAVRARRLIARRRVTPIVSAPVFALLLLVLPLAAQKGVNVVANACIDKVIAGRASDATLTTLVALRHLRPIDRMVWAYAEEHDGRKKESIARDYRRITGQPIEKRLASLMD